ncbi:putative SANT/Myb domain, Homeobox-like domain superfamily protein [Plasmopara halstedii]
MDHVKRESYSNDNFRRGDYVMPLKKVRAHHHATTQFKTLHSLNATSHRFLQESESWRGSSGFGLANILNRSCTSTAPTSTMPKLNLPSFPHFGKTSVSNSEMSLRYENDSRYVSGRFLHEQRSADSSPAQQPPPSPSPRRFALVSVDDEDPEQEMENTASGAHDSTINYSIRGGRWSADEHERFLEGFRIHGHKWKRVQQVVCTRSVTQVRTHAQKYLLKVAKLKAEKKQSGKNADMATLASESHKRSMKGETADGLNSAFMTPELCAAHDSPLKTPMKKVRYLDHGKCDPVDQQYIADAATTLCFLMSQKIDSLFESRHDLQLDGHKSDYEPYDCYASKTTKSSDIIRSEPRKRSYMHFITDEQDDYSSYSRRSIDVHNQRQ